MPELLSSIAELAWPVAVVIGLVLFARPLAGLLHSGRDRDEVTFEIGGQRLTLGKLRQQQNELMLDLQRQVEELRTQLAQERAARAAGRPAPPQPEEPEDAEENEAEEDERPGPPDPAGPPARIRPRKARERRAPNRSVLWVDDQPENNALLIEQLTTSGAHVDIATSTTEGLALASRRDYGAVITDLGRTENGGFRPDAGLDLVRQLRAAGDPAPTIVYSSERSAATRGPDVTAAGAQEITASGGEVLGFLRRLGVLG